MNFQELDSFNLADAVKFNDSLNPRIWQDMKMRPEVREKLLAIAADFQESLGVDNLAVKDITVSGSNAGFTYTPQSDIDLHLVVEMPQDCDEVYQELFNAKKYQYNDEHDIRIGGYDVELYVQPADQPHVSAGVYSVANDDWIHIPRKIAARVDDESVRNKYEDIKARIESALKSSDIDRMRKLWDKIKEMRQSGLAENGELGPENLAFKMLRTQGDLGKLKDAIARARDAELSLTERRKKKKKSQVKYGFGGHWYPGFGFGAGETSDAGDGGGGESRMREDVTLTPDGVSPSTKMFLSEKDVPNQTEIIFDFMRFAVHELELHNVPTLKIKKDPQWSVIHKSFGRYRDDLGQIDLAVGNRHIMDVLRTLAHELQHRKQDEREHMPPGAGKTGSRFENEAHAVAGVLMRKYADLHPEYFEDVPVNEASGYIPTRAQARDPRFKMALTVDVHPGETGRQANKMALKTDAQGRPALLMKTANMIGEAAKTKSHGYNTTPLSQVPGEQEDDLGNQEATGPEFPPRMPAGTTKIDVADLTDWYRLGQDISDMDDADPANYGKGPPQTVVVFPSDEAEQGYLKQFKRLGLKTHDMDPDVEGGEDVEGKHLEKDLLKQLREYKEQDLFEIRMSTASLRQEAAKTGAQAGMEFEMIVPDVGLDDVEPEYEPDYDYDQRARSFSDVRDFFHDGDYNGRRDVDNLIDELAGEYEEWKQEQTAESWERDGQEFMTDYVSLNDLFDRDEAMLQARDEIMDANPDLPQESEDFSNLLTARLDEMEREFAAQEFENRGRIYDQAFEAFAEEQADEYDEGSFLDDKYPRMINVQGGFDIQWPYYIDINADNDGADVNRVADEFSSYMGKPVNASTQYHGGRRESGAYVVEPDGSLEGDNPGDEGLEFVSHPMPIDEMISDLNKVKAWADKTGCYTNDSTGLHINISVPNYSLDKLDYIKLALLMGDEYVLDLFGRSGNSYAKSAISKIKAILQKNPDLAPQVMDKMREHMEDIATKAIHSGITDKYTSINTKSGYIEFRSPGGDWLDSNFSKIENTLLRFTVALSAAINPEAYRQEYLKKLYKLLEGSQEKGGPDIVQLFANYSAGELDKAALIRQVREKQLARDVAKGKAPAGQQYWWNVQWDANRRMEVVASNKEVAREVAAEEWGVPVEQLAIARVTMLRPYEPPVPKTAAQTSGPTLNGRPSNPDGNFIIRQREDDRVVYRFMAADAADVQTVVDQWSAQNPGRWFAERDTNQVFGQPSPQPAQGQSGNWGIFMTHADRFARAPGQVDNNVLRRFPSREAAEQFITQARAENPNMRTDIEVREIEPAAQPQFQEPDANRGDLTPRGPGPWEIYRLSDNSSVRVLSHTDRPSAEVEARMALGYRGEAPELYGVRTRASTDAAQGGTVDVATDRAAPAARPPEFTGNWLIKDASGSVLHRFGGIGNNQGDANRIAMQWLRSNPALIAGGVEVVPEMA